MKAWVRLMMVSALIVGVALRAQGEAAEAAWGKLTGKLADRPAFAWVEQREELPNVLIYGDSISIGYTPGVRAHLAETANVYRIHVNGGPSGSFTEKIKDLETTMRAPDLAGRWDFEWDVIHCNVGLHDLKYVDDQMKLDLDRGTLVASVQDYMRNLRQIIAHLQATAPQAKVIFALTTKVPAGAGGRIEDAELVYNAAARRVLADYPEITINDLRTVSLPFLQPGNVHFKSEGIAVQAEHVAKVIAAHLPPSS